MFSVGAIVRYLYCNCLDNSFCEYSVLAVVIIEKYEGTGKKLVRSIDNNPVIVAHERATNKQRTIFKNNATRPHKTQIHKCHDDVLTCFPIH